jgi:hypothetical protein
LILVIPGILFVVRSSKRSGTHRVRGRRRRGTPEREPGSSSADPGAPKLAGNRPWERRKPPSPAELADDPRYAEAVQIVFRAVAALPRLPSGVPDPEDVRGAFESSVSYLVAAGIAVEEARTNLRQLIAAKAARSSPGADGKEAPRATP